MCSGDSGSENLRRFGTYGDACARNLAILLAACHLSVILATFPDYGISTDERSHIEYGYSVVRWYTSFFQDFWVFSWADVWLYGGFYDLICHLAAGLSPFGLFETRHLCNALMGLIGVAGAYVLGHSLGGPWSGFLAAVFLVLTPRYYGHSFINHKDIPFSVLYLWSVIWMTRGLDGANGADRFWRLKTGIIIGLTMGIRVGGLILFVPLGTMVLLKHLQEAWRAGTGYRTVLTRAGIQVGSVFSIAYATMLVFWPWAQTDPIRNPFRAIAVFSRFPSVHTSFFEGRFVRSTELPWSYVPKWLLLTLPEFVLLGLCTGAVLVVLFLVRKGTFGSNAMKRGLVTLAVGFPMVWIAATRMPLYNGLRHVLFLIPPICVLAAVSLREVLALSSGWRRSVTMSLVGVSLAWALGEMVLLHPNQYIYFNRVIAGGLAHAARAYETDYWDNSYREGAEWLSEHVVPADRKTRVSSGTYALETYLDPTRFESVPLPWDADFLLVTTRTEQHTVIPGEVVHTVDRYGVPLLYIIRPDSLYRDDPLFQGTHAYRPAHLAYLYEHAGRIEDALATLLRALDTHPDEGILYFQLGRILYEQGEIEAALSHLIQGVQLGHRHGISYCYMGDCLAALGRKEEAIGAYEQALRLRPYYLRALRNLGRLYFESGSAEAALSYLSRATRIDRESIPDRLNLGIGYYMSGDAETALGIFESIAQVEGSEAKLYFAMGTAYQNVGKIQKARSAFQRALLLEPGHVEARERLEGLDR